MRVPIVLRFRACVAAIYHHRIANIQVEILESRAALSSMALTDRWVNLSLKNTQVDLGMYKSTEDQKMTFIKLRGVMELTSLARSTIYKFISEGSFPKQVKLGGNCVAWVEDEVLEWMEARLEDRELGEDAS